MIAPWCERIVTLLAGGIAHDFNNILGAILGYGEPVQNHLPERGARAP